MVRVVKRPYAYARPGFGRSLFKYAIGQGIKYAVNYRKQYTKTKGKESNSGVTIQHDVKTQYVKKRMPRRRRRQWRKFVKKVEAVGNRGQGLKTVLLNDSVTCAPTGLAQDYCLITLYGNAGENTAKENGNADLKEISTNDPEFKDTKSVQFRSAVVDLTMSNTSYGVAPGTLEVDVYYVQFHKSENENKNLTFAMAVADSVTTTMSGGANIVNLYTRGATPFTCGQLVRESGMKVIWKKKYLISAGQAATMQHRDPRNVWISKSDISPDQTDMTYKNLTRGFLMIVKALNSGQTGPQLEVRATRTYTYKLMAGKTGEIQNEAI